MTNQRPASNRFIDLTGKRCGRLVVTAYAGGGKWFCRCDCNTCRVVCGSSLRSGHAQSCGCLKFIDLTGRRFERLLVTGYVGNQKYFCECDCGNDVIVFAGNLRRGHTKSCGCLNRELVSARSLIDVTGKRFRHWVVSARAQNRKWACVCNDCGARADIDGYSLRRGRAGSCGCHKNLTGRRYGRLTVVGYAQNSRWSCVCDCNTHVEVDGSHLREGDTRSCGCLKRELTVARFTTHGMSRSPEYNRWSCMKQRCLNPRATSFKYYGAIGILPSDEWLKFENYFADTGAPPPGCSVDRIDPNGGYNCCNWQWADAKTQRHNRRQQRAHETVKRRQAEMPLPPLDDPPF